MSGDVWDTLTPSQRERIVWLTDDAILTLRTDAIEDVIRFAVNAYASVTNLVPGRWTSKEYLEDQRIRAYDNGWEDGHQAGKDEALDAVEQLASAKAKAVVS